MTDINILTLTAPSPDDWTLDDVAEFEALTGTRLSEATKGGLSTAGIKAALYIQNRKEFPELTHDECGTLTMKRINELFAVDGSVGEGSDPLEV